MANTMHDWTNRPTLSPSGGTDQTMRTEMSDQSLIAGRYILDGTIGAGGSARVYRAHDVRLPLDPLAVKLIMPAPGDDASVIARLLNEVRIVRTLGHPHIVRVYDFGVCDNGAFYITMELVKGANLATLLDEAPDGSLSIADTLTVLLQVSTALAYAHSAGVVHRDIKPANILVGEDHLAKLTDFGAAKLLKVDAKITPTGEIIGTPHYLAPEIFRGEAADERSDIYSLGILAYELLTGTLPFDHESIFQLASMHLTYSVPDMRAIRPTLPTWFQDFVEVCCEKSAADRYQTAGDIIIEILDQLQTLSIPPQLAVLPPEALARLSHRRAGGSALRRWLGFLVRQELP